MPAPTIQPDEDVTTTNWTAVPSGTFYTTIDETVLNKADYVETTTPLAPLVIGMGDLPQGSWVRIDLVFDGRIEDAMGTAYIRARLTGNPQYQHKITAADLGGYSTDGSVTKTGWYFTSPSWQDPISWEFALVEE